MANQSYATQNYLETLAKVSKPTAPAPKFNLFDFSNKAPAPIYTSSVARGVFNTPTTTTITPPTIQANKTQIDLLKQKESIQNEKPTIQPFPRPENPLSVPQGYADNTGTGYLEDLQADINKGMPKEKVNELYPELGGNSKVIDSLYIDLKAGMPLSEIPKLYPELYTPTTPTEGGFNIGSIFNAGTNLGKAIVPGAKDFLSEVAYNTGKAGQGATNLISKGITGAYNIATGENIQAPQFENPYTALEREFTGKTNFPENLQPTTALQDLGTYFSGFTTSAVDIANPIFTGTMKVMQNTETGKKILEDPKFGPTLGATLGFLSGKWKGMAVGTIIGELPTVINGAVDKFGEGLSDNDNENLKSTLTNSIFLLLGGNKLNFDKNLIKDTLKNGKTNIKEGVKDITSIPGKIIPESVKINRAINNAYDSYNKAIGTKVASKKNPILAQQHKENVIKVGKDIVENKDNLFYTDAEGKIIGEGTIPKSVEELSQATTQRMEGIFNEYRNLEKKTGLDTSVSYDKVIENLQLLKDKVSNNPEQQHLIKFIDEKIANYKKVNGNLDTTIEAKKTLNQNLKSFFAKALYGDVGKDIVDMVVNKTLGEILDEKIANSNYSELKKKWGSYKSLQDEIFKRNAVNSRQKEFGFFDLSNPITVLEFIEGIATGNPVSLVKAGGIQGLKWYMKYRNNPNTQVKEFFKNIEKSNLSSNILKNVNSNTSNNSNSVILPSKQGGNVNPTLLKKKSQKLLPVEGQSNYKVITPQTKERAIIQESKKGLENTKIGNKPSLVAKTDKAKIPATKPTILKKESKTTQQKKILKPIKEKDYKKTESEKLREGIYFGEKNKDILTDKGLKHLQANKLKYHGLDTVEKQNKLISDTIELLNNETKLKELGKNIEETKNYIIKNRYDIWKDTGLTNLSLEDFKKTILQQNNTKPPITKPTPTINKEVLAKVKEDIIQGKEKLYPLDSVNSKGLGMKQFLQKRKDKGAGDFIQIGKKEFLLSTNDGLSVIDGSNGKYRENYITRLYRENGAFEKQVKERVMKDLKNEVNKYKEGLDDIGIYNTKEEYNKAKQNLDWFEEKLKNEENLTPNTLKNDVSNKTIKKPTETGGKTIKDKVGDLVDKVAEKVGAKINLLGGEGAKGIQVTGLDKAKQMEKLGTNADKIWQSTGWEKGADGKWKFEIDDSKAKFDIKKVGYKTNIEDVLKHEELFKQYPELKKIKITKMATSDSSFNPDTMEMTLGTYADTPKSTVLHEIQHYIQKQEGFASGGNPDMFKGTKIVKENKYKSLAGETEARNIQTRLLKTPSERKILRPAKTEDIARDKQIIKMEGGEAKMIKKDPLIEEARKYKSAEEFIDKYTLDSNLPLEANTLTKIPLNKIRGLDYPELENALIKGKTLTKSQIEDIISPTDDFVKGKSIKNAIGVIKNKDGTYSLMGGNHRIAQAILNGDKEILSWYPGLKGEINLKQIYDQAHGKTILKNK